MSSTQTFNERWWVDGRDQPPVPGTLSIAEGELRLTIWKPRSRSLQEVLQSASQQETIETPRVILGRDEDDHPVSLFGCSVGEYRSAAGVEKVEIGALAGVQGLEIDSWKSPVGRAVLIKIDLLHRWFDRRLLVTARPDCRESFAPEERIDLVFDLQAGIRVRLFETTTYSQSADEFRFRPDSQMWFHFDQPRSLGEIRDKWVPWITRFLSLLVGTTVSPDAVSVFPEDPFEPSSHAHVKEGRLLPPFSRSARRAMQPPHPHNMIASFRAIRRPLADILSHWNRVCQQLEPVVDLFSAVALHHNLFSEARFLFLVQALEIYHACTPVFESLELPKQQHKEWLCKALSILPAELREWAKGKLQMNFRSLRKKLTDIFQAHLGDASLIFGDVERAASRIAYTRNYYTHHHEKADAERLIPEHEIGEVSYGLEAMLWIVLLKELELDGAPVERLLRRIQNVRFVDLSE